MKKFLSILFVLSAMAASFADATAKPATTKAPAADTKKEMAALSVTGTIVELQADKSKKTEGTLVVVDTAKKQFSIVLKNGVKLFDAKKKVIKLKDLAKGKSVTVKYTDDGKTLTASVVTLD